MIPPEIDYFHVEDLPTAFQVLANHRNEDPIVLAGGQGLVPRLKQRTVNPSVVVDISQVSRLNGINVNNSLEIGPLTTHTEVASSELVPKHGPTIATAVEHAADKQIRNQATIGGNLVEAATGADPPAAVVAADATFTIQGHAASETVAAEAFYDRTEPRLETTELLTGISIPLAENRIGGYARKTEPASGYAAPGVAVAGQLDSDRLAAVRIAVAGIATTPRRLPTVETSLEGLSISEITKTESEIEIEEAIAEDLTARVNHRSGSPTWANLPAVVEQYTLEALDDAIEQMSTVP